MQRFWKNISPNQMPCEDMQTLSAPRYPAAWKTLPSDFQDWHTSCTPLLLQVQHTDLPGMYCIFPALTIFPVIHPRKLCLGLVGRSGQAQSLAPCHAEVHAPGALSVFIRASQCLVSEHIAFYGPHKQTSTVCHGLLLFSAELLTDRGMGCRHPVYLACRAI